MNGRQVCIAYAACALINSTLGGLIATEIMPWHDATFVGSWLTDFTLIIAAHGYAAPFIGPRLERWLTSRAGGGDR